MFNYWCIFVLLLVIVCKESLCDICTTCVCFTIDAGPIIDCHKKHLGSNEILNFELLTLDERRQLYGLILSGNNIVLLSIRVLQNLKYLRKLDLSENRLDSAHVNTFRDLKNLEDLNFSNNRLYSFDISILNAFPSLSKFNLSHNKIRSLERSLPNTTTKLAVLDLSHNNITDLHKSFFDSLPQLEYLDLSFNELNSLNGDSLVYLQHLKILHIDNNYLRSLDLREFPTSLLKLYIGHNLITSLSFTKSFIRTLSIEHNRISDLWEDLTLLRQLQYLNVSENALSDFPNIALNSMEILDISYNNLSMIPESISIENLPVLRVLNVTGNHLHNIKFHSRLTLQVLEANYLNMLEDISKDTFLKLNAVSTYCINMTISNNMKLITVHENAFQHMNICALDLGNNRFTYISSKLVDNQQLSNMKYLINLQGNPFYCDCSLQWMLNDLIPLLYVKQPRLLENLRCAGPSPLTNKRIVHWYKWNGEIFCNNFSDLAEKMTANVESVSSRKVITFETSPGLLVVLGITITLLTILVIIGILLTRRMVTKKRRVNRRF